MTLLLLRDKPWQCIDMSRLVRSACLIPLVRQIVAIALGFTLLSSGILLAGCGQKGPLYIPDTPSSEESEDSEG
ncbi:MAG: lipoprotein [Arenicellales bacterium]